MECWTFLNVNVFISCPVCILLACGQISFELGKKAALIDDGFTFLLANTLQFLMGVVKTSYEIDNTNIWFVMRLVRKLI